MTTNKRILGLVGGGQKSLGKLLGVKVLCPWSPRSTILRYGDTDVGVWGSASQRRAARYSVRQPSARYDGFVRLEDRFDQQSVVTHNSGT